MIEYESDLMPLFSKNETNIEDFLPEDVIVKYGNIRL